MIRILAIVAVLVGIVVLAGVAASAFPTMQAGHCYRILSGVPRYGYQFEEIPCP